MNDRELIDCHLTVAQTECEVTSAKIEDFDDKELTIKLSEDGLREFITELRLEDYDQEASDWLANNSTADMTTEE